MLLLRIFHNFPPDGPDDEIRGQHDPRRPPEPEGLLLLPAAVEQRLHRHAVQLRQPPQRVKVGLSPARLPNIRTQNGV